MQRIEDPIKPIAELPLLAESLINTIVIVGQEGIPLIFKFLFLFWEGLAKT